MTRREAAIISAYTQFLIGNCKELKEYLVEVKGDGVGVFEMITIMEKHHNGKIKEDFLNIKIED